MDPYNTPDFRVFKGPESVPASSPAAAGKGLDVLSPKAERQIFIFTFSRLALQLVDLSRGQQCAPGLF